MDPDIQRQDRAVLDERVVRDLNADPRLPFADGSFDVVLNTVSVDYVTRPLELFREVGRVLRPGGLFLVIFSNRYFPEKAVRIWRESSEQERILIVEDDPDIGMTLEHVLGKESFRVALTATPLNTFGEGLQVDMESLAVFQAEQQIRRALQQPGQQPRALRKMGRLTKEIGSRDACTVQRHAITGDRQPFTGIQPS